MAEPTAVAVMRRFKDRLLAGEAAEHTALARAWARVEADIDSDLVALAHEVTRLHEAGQPVGISKLVKLARYRSMLGQVTDALASFRDTAGNRIVGRQRQMVLQGLDDAVGVIRAAGWRDPFTVVPFRAVEFMVGLAGDGSPLTDLLARALLPDAVAGITSALVRGVARGFAPAQTARAMRDGSRLGLSRALTIARTEQMRAYRESSRMQYQESGAVLGFKRLATKDRRTCVACLVSDGERYELGDSLRAHVQCRCTTVPIVKGFAAVEWETGASWLKSQDEATQRNILGKGRFDAWKSGDVSLDRMVTIKTNSTWGDSAVPTPVGAL